MADVLVEELLNHDLLFADPERQCLPSNGAVLPRLPSSEAGTPRSASDGKSVTPPDNQAGPAVLVHVEGTHDVEFLRRISRVLCKHNPTIPDLGLLEANGLIAFFTSTSSSLSSLALDRSVAEFCLYDREVPPMTDERTQLVSLKPAFGLSCCPDAEASHRELSSSRCHPGSGWNRRHLRRLRRRCGDRSQGDVQPQGRSLLGLVVPPRPPSTARQGEKMAESRGRRPDDAGTTRGAIFRRRSDRLASHDR